MDVKKYFRQIRELQQELGPEDVVVYSLPTVDGGLEGVLTEVAPALASKLVIEGRARLASNEETERFRQSQREAALEAEEAALANRIQVQVIQSDPGGAKTGRNKK
jgi:hypothetical protein